MFYNYLKIALRNLKRQKGYSLINIAGLAIGMASAILILLWIQDELSYDRFHQYSDRLYRVTDYEKYSNGEEVFFSMNPADLAPTLLETYPEIINTCRLRTIGNVVFQYGDNRFNESGLGFVDPSFLKMFTFPLIGGSPENLLSDPNSLVITEEMAKKYFENENPIGKTISIDNRIDFIVAGVMENMPSNSHLNLNFLVPFETIKEFGHGYEITGWNSWAYTTYVLLEDQTDYRELSHKMSNIVQKYQDEAIVSLSLQPVTDIHLRSGRMWGIGGTGDIKYVYIFAIISGFILLLACINFMNLATARAGNRAKEVGLRKAIGAYRKEIILQFYSESFIISAISLLFSVLLVMEFLPIFNSLSGKELRFDLLGNKSIFLIILTVATVTGFISGSYPALFLSSFKPIKVLKGTLALGSKSTIFRKLLVSFQFMLTIVLIIGTIVVNRQLYFIKNQKLGFNKEQVLCVKLQGNLNQKLDILKGELKKIPDVTDVSGVSQPPSRIRTSTIISEWEGRDSDDQFLMYLMSADHDFLNTMEIEIGQGRYFSRELKTDTSEGIIVNEAAVRAMGMKSPLGKKIFDNRIIGMVKDFHFYSLHSKIGPLAIYFDPRKIEQLLVRVNSANISPTINAIETSWKKLVPAFPIQYTFLDEQIDDLYRSEQRVEKVVNTFSFLALLIACLGLFGLASYTAEQRTKEVGIRKVLGASASGIVLLLSKEFTRYVIIANLIAWPTAYLVLNKWLQNFAYHIDLSWWFFLSAGMLALIIAVLTVSWQAIRVAITNPVKALRYE
jgi:ABC-type antimicrobial peptide transport system permease subunit